MKARLTTLLLSSALVASAACVAGYVLSAPGDAGPSGPLLRASWHRDVAAASEADAALSGRERPAQRPLRSDFDDPARRVRASSAQALVLDMDAKASH